MIKSEAIKLHISYILHSTLIEGRQAMSLSWRLVEVRVVVSSRGKRFFKCEFELQGRNHLYSHSFGFRFKQRHQQPQVYIGSGELSKLRNTLFADDTVV